MSFKLPKKIVTAMDALTAEMDLLIDELRSEYDDKSERWQESDAADEVSAWLDELEELRDNIDAFPREAGK